MRFIVCGGRDYQDLEAVYTALAWLHADKGISMIIHGAAPGADSLAETWAKDAQVPYLGVPARWKELGKAAGPERNARMLKFKPDGVVAFPGGYGTQNMIDQAIRAGIKVWQPIASVHGRGQ